MLDHAYVPGGEIVSAPAWVYGIRQGSRTDPYVAESRGALWGLQVDLNCQQLTPGKRFCGELVLCIGHLYRHSLPVATT